MADNVNRPADDAITNRDRAADSPRIAASRQDGPGDARSGAARVETEAVPGDHTTQEAWIGTDDPRLSNRNVSWGAIIAGAVTFIALMMLFGVGAAALGLQDAGATAVGIWTLVGLVVSFLVAGYVAGALGVRGGLLHGFLTWATSLLAVIFLAGWLGTSVLGAFGNIAGTVAEATNITGEDAQGVADEVSPEDAAQAEAEAEALADEATQAVEEAAPEAAEGTWWTFGGLVVGAVLASLAGVAGSRSVVNKREEVVAGNTRV